MGNDDDQIFVIRQEIAEPFRCFSVQVIRRFVHQQNVGTAEKGLRQKDFDFVFTAQFTNKRIVQTFGDTQVREQLRSVRFSHPAVHFAKFAFKFGGVHRFSFRCIRVIVDGIFFNHDVIKAFMPHHNGVQNAHIVERKVILRENRQTIARFDANFAAIGFNFARKNFNEGRFARAIRSDDTIAITFCEFEVDLIE